jgi:kynurenine 3-monooxygenase
MLIALPNMDGSFTVTLFLSYSEGVYNFDNLVSENKIIEFFEKDFPDTLSLIPDILKEFENNPTGKLGTIKCYPWAYKGHTLLLGDSSHAIVPFYGQGMNASFEDVYVLDAVLNQFEGNWSTVFSEFQKQRKIDADAIADLAIDNYFEMRDHVANPIFKEKRTIEMSLEKFFPSQYFSKYSLVTFNEHIGYHEAMTKGRAQDKVLLKMIKNSSFTLTSQPSEELFHQILHKVQEETNKLLE